MPEWYPSSSNNSGGKSAVSLDISEPSSPESVDSRYRRQGSTDAGGTIADGANVDVSPNAPSLHSSTSHPQPPNNSAPSPPPYGSGYRLSSARYSPSLAGNSFLPPVSPPKGYAPSPNRPGDSRPTSARTPKSSSTAAPAGANESGREKSKTPSHQAARLPFPKADMSTPRRTALRDPRYSRQMSKEVRINDAPQEQSTDIDGRRQPYAQGSSTPAPSQVPLDPLRVSPTATRPQNGNPTGSGGPSGANDAGNPGAPGGSQEPPKPTAAPAPSRRLLEVNVLEAAGLLAVQRGGGGVSNPWANVFLVDLANHEVKSEGQRSSPVVNATLKPVWNFKTEFGHKVNLSQPPGGNLPTLRIQLFSRGSFGKQIPLGGTDIPLTKFGKEGAELDEWYPLEPFGKLLAGGRLGSVHLRLKMGKIVRRGSAQRSNSLASELDMDRYQETGGDEPEDCRDLPPNYFRVTLHQAQDLRAKDIATSSSDPFVIVRIGDKEFKTKTVKQNLAPVWEETFSFVCGNSGDTLELTVRDEDQIGSEFLGFLSILVGDMADKRQVRQWFDLTLANGQLNPGDELGLIEITTQWYHNPDVDIRPVKTGNKGFLSAFTTGGSDTEDEDEETKKHESSKEETEKRGEEAKREETERTELMKELRDFKVVSGDYVAYVHVIEARELKGEDNEGTSDPVVYVEGFGQKYATPIQSSRLNAVFDETFVFNLRNMDQEEFKAGVFRISVLDADGKIGPFGFLRADLIGAVSFDASYVYFNKDHEVHRRWVALVDDLNPNDRGIQGYLQLSIAIVGPGDRLKIHNEEEDRRKEREAIENSGGVDSLVVMPPSVEIKQVWLVTTAVKAEYLPVMDATIIGGAGGGDFFFQMEVAGGKGHRSRPISMTGDRYRLNPEWRAEMWHPVTWPCMSGNIKYTVWDQDTGGNQLVATFFSRLKGVRRRKKAGDEKPATRWVNLYGPPVYIPESSTIIQLGRQAATLGTQKNYFQHYLDAPHAASTYRGRVLISERLEEEAPRKHKNDTVAFRKKVKMPQVPRATLYVLKAFVGAGTELPRFTDINLIGTKKMWVRISVGRHEVSTNVVDNVGGVCEWYRSLEIKTNFFLPADPSQVPDLIVHLMVGSGAGSLPFAFARFKAEEIMNSNFGGRPTWHHLKEDKALDALVENEFAGSVLIQLGFGTKSEYVKHWQNWNAEYQGLIKREKYELRVHLYQARNLPAADSTGLLDPYLKIRFGGMEKSTEDVKELRRRETVDPAWYSTIRIPATLPPKNFQRFFPQVAIRLFDYDFGFTHDYGGNIFLSLEDIEIIEADRRTKELPAPPRPGWHSFFMEAPGDGQGELLVSLQLIQIKGGDLPRPVNIIPTTRKAYLDIILMGIRNMQPYAYLPIELPYCVFEVDGMDGTKKTFRTEVSNKPSGSDANFLQRIKMELELPEDVIYAPRVQIRVYDTRLGGYNQPLVAAGRIELTKKLPWSKDYEAPLSKIFAREHLLQAMGAETEEDEMMLAAEAGDPPSVGSVGSSRGFQGFVFDSEDGSESEDSHLVGTAMLSDMGKSGFGVGPKSSFVRRTPSRSPAGSRRVYTRDNMVSRRQMSTTDFGGGGGGALGALNERNWNGPADNMCVTSATTGDVVDDGVGITPALDAARQRYGMLTTAERLEADQAQAGGAGVTGDALGAAGSASGHQDGAPLGRAPSIGAGSATPSKRNRSQMFDDLWEEDDKPQTPPYLLGREQLGQSLEDEFEDTTPFETYDLSRGQTLGLKAAASLRYFLGTERPSMGTLRVVGKLKCIVRVTQEDPRNVPLFVQKSRFESLEKAKKEDERILNELLKPRGYKVRLYALQALNLTPMDFGIAGRPGKSDPYMRVKLGKEVFDDQKNYIDDVTDADLFKCVEITCELPGASQLEIEIMDYDTIGRDDLIGKTVIDLEDRWFDTRWQAWGIQNRIEDLGTRRWQTKPVEDRILKVPTSMSQQGILSCWVDLMTPEDAKAFPQDDIALPPARDFEVRIVFWKCKNVVPMDSITEQNDLFVRSWVEGCDKQETDTHWFAKRGKASFNWRMKFKISLGPRTRVWKFPYLTVQLWDRDILKWNDHIAEGMLDLGKYFRKAYEDQERQPVVLFREERKKDAKRKTDERVDAKNMRVDRQQGKLSTEAPDQPLIPNIDAPRNSLVRLDSSIMDHFEDEDEDEEGNPGGEPPGAAGASDPRGDVELGLNDVTSGGRRATVRKKMQTSCWRSCCRSLCGCGRTKESSPGEDSDEEAVQDAKALINTFKQLTGLGEEDPDDSRWIRMEKINRTTRKREPMGQCLVGVQIWPIEKAELKPVGFGRNDPNIDPFLPPPVGRVRFSLNPFVMGSEIFGAKICFRLSCVICCILSILFCVYFSPVLNFIVTIFTTLS